VGDDLNIGNLGLTLNFQVTGELGIRTGYSHSVFGNDGLNTSLLRFQIVYGWHRSTEDMKKLKGAH